MKVECFHNFLTHLSLDINVFLARATQDNHGNSTSVLVKDLKKGKSSFSSVASGGEGGRGERSERRGEQRAKRAYRRRPRK